MELLQLKYFQVVARTENISLSAKELYVAQSSLSQTISRLEKSIGVRLFDRKGKKLHLNEYGKIFLNRVDKAIIELDKGILEMRNLAQHDEKAMVIGFTDSDILSGVISKFSSAQTHTNIRLLKGIHRLTLQKLLLTGEIDFCLSTKPLDQAGVHSEAIKTEELFIAVSANHPLAAHKSVQLLDVINLPFITSTRESEYREITNEFFQKSGCYPSVIFEGQTPDIICGLVRSGSGATFLPSSWLDCYNLESVAKLHVDNVTCERTFWLSWMNDRLQSKPFCDFRDHIIKTCHATPPNLAQK